MVVWLFDQSASLRAQRAQIAKQFDRVYQQLERFQGLDKKQIRENDIDPPLLTDIYQFGQTVSPLLNEPTYKLDKLRDAVSNVCLLYTSPSPRDQRGSRMPSSA